MVIKMGIKRERQTLTKIIEEPMVSTEYKSVRTRNLSSSPLQSIYICLIPTTVSSWCCNESVVAFGANFFAYSTTVIGKVALQRRIWAVDGMLLRFRGLG